MTEQEKSAPRMRGDDPSGLLEEYPMNTCSPHARG